MKLVLTVPWFSGFASTLNVFAFTIQKVVVGIPYKQKKYKKFRKYLKEDLGTPPHDLR